MQVYQVEQHHEKLSPFRFVELPRDGLGDPVNYTGAVRCTFSSEHSII